MQEYSRFTLKDHVFIAYGPENDSDRQEWQLDVLCGDHLINTVRIPLDFRPIFGYDVSDLQRLDDNVELVIKELKLE